MPNKILWIIGGTVVGLNWIAGIIAYPHLPERVAIHWNIAGEVDRWGSAWMGAFLVPLIMSAIFVLFILMPRIDPKKDNYLQMGKTYGSLLLVTLLVLSVVYLGTLGATLGYLENLPSIVKIGIGVMFIVIGNYMGKLKYNYLVGIRTPWTLANEEVWYKTHRMAGPFWMVGGLLYIATGLISSTFFMSAFIITILIVILVPVVYSFIIFKRSIQ